MNHGVSASDVSVIVTTYEWPEALRLVLDALDRQTVDGFEVVLADDGSGQATRTLVEDFRSERFRLRHAWQPHTTYRAARARNLAVAISRGSYLVFIDGDCLVRADFIERHAQLARVGRLQRGNRILLNRAYTESLAAGGRIDELMHPRSWPRLRREGAFGRIVPLLQFPLGPLRGYRRIMPLVQRPLDPLRGYKWTDWKGVKTSNLGISRREFESVNGFDEAFQGWGHEDADLAIRLLRNGVRRSEATFATTVFHMWHPKEDRSSERRNAARLLESRSGPIVCLEGLSQHLGNGSMR